MTPNTIDLRHQLHQHPGISGNECFAHDTIVSFLSSLHPDALHTHVDGYGVIASWGSPSLPAIAFRADTDALPYGHCCGHDGHTAILLHLAALVAAHRPAQRCIVLCFQPEEETGAGSQKLIDSGLLQQYDIRAFFGLHNLPGFPLGRLVFNSNTFAAASTGICLHLQGRQTHASTPEKGINPGLAAATFLQRMATLNTSPDNYADFMQATLVGLSLGGNDYGISAGSADIHYTLRAFTNNAMQRLLDATLSTAQALADSNGLTLSHTLHDTFRATENNTQLVDLLGLIARQQGFDHQLIQQPFRWSEDFANYLTLWPGAFFGIGAGEDHLELHHPDYDFPDAIIDTAAHFFFAIANHNN